ncbi:MAG TPA: glyoxylate/hydroxypyruvate reductase A [Aliidongia sp.]|nr:glyoxylate/hydroxypyruvate reductase A [Aliidongia sp.]
MIVGFYEPGTNLQDPFYLAWQAALRLAAPEIELRCAADLGDPAEIEAAMVWKPAAGWLAALPNLKLILSLGAGVDHVLADPQLPRSVPLLRLIDPAMTRAMVEYMVFQTLRLHLKEPAYRRQQATSEWRQLTPPPPARDRRVGILGLGELGGATAEALIGLGFDVAGWSRSPKRLAGVETFAGAAGLPAFLARSEILLCLLPLTPDTAGILSRSLFEQLPKGAGLINAGRGKQLVEADLLAALESEQIAEAVLDVFAQEPLPAGHPFWTHPHIVVTPHVAAATNPVTAVVPVAANLRRLAAGDAFADRVDLSAGY